MSCTRPGTCPGAPWPPRPNLASVPLTQGQHQDPHHEEEPPGALPEGLGFELDLSCLLSILPTLLHAHPEVFLNEETNVFSLPLRANGRIQENAFKCKKYLKRSADNTGVTCSTSF